MAKTESKVGVGIVGCGFVAHMKHLPALKEIPEAEIVSVFDFNAGRAQEVAENFGAVGCKVCTDFEEVIRDPNVDTVYILTSNVTHSEYAVRALDAGKHVLCEKPMAINAAEAKKMYDASVTCGKLLTIGYQNRHTDENRFLKNEAAAGTFGEIYYSRAIALRRRAVPTWGVFLNAAEQGGGPLIDIGTHALDLTLWMMDNYRPKYCLGSTYHKLNQQQETGNAWGDWDPAQFTVEDSAFGMVVMENGATVSVEAAWAINMADTREATTLLCGTKGGADTLDGVRINGIRQGKQYLLRPDFTAGGVAFYAGNKDCDAPAREAQQWIRAITDGTEVCVKPFEAYTVTRILEGIYESAKSGELYRF